MLLSPSPSIDELLANLQGGNAPPPASLQNMQPGPLPPGLLGLPPAGQPTLRPTGNSMGDRIHRFLVDHVVGAPPAGASAIASPEEIQAARPGLLSTFAKNALMGGHDEWKQNILDAQGMKQIAQSTSDAANVRAARQNMLTAFPARPGETQAQMNDRLEAMLLYSAQHGDLEMVNAIKEVVSKTAEPSKVQPHEPMQIHGIKAAPDSKVADQTVTQLRDPYTQRILDEMPEGAVPMSEDAKALRQIALDAGAESRALLTKSREDNLDAGQVRLFQTQHTQLLQNAQKFARFLPTLEQAKQGNPAAVAPLLYGMVSNTDLNAQMRQGILQLLEMPAGALNRGELWFTQHVSGKLDPKMISNIENLVRAAHGTDVQEYTKFWDRAVKANPRLAAHPDMMPPDELFKIPGQAGVSAQQGAARVRQFLPQR